MSHDLMAGLVIGYGFCRVLGLLGAYKWTTKGTRNNHDR